MKESGTSGENSKTNYRSGRKRSPLDLRLKLYVEVLGLTNKSYSYSEIEAVIAKRYGVSIAKGTISSWVRRINSPFNSGHVFVPKPTPELAYVIGVETGDASLNAKLKTYQYRVRLQAVDREFVEAFSQAVAGVLRCVPHRLWKGDTARETHVEYGSYLLHKFLQQPFETLKPFIERSKRCMAAFVRVLRFGGECRYKWPIISKQYEPQSTRVRSISALRVLWHGNRRPIPGVKEGKPHGQARKIVCTQFRLLFYRGQE